MTPFAKPATRFRFAFPLATGSASGWSFALVGHSKGGLKYGRPGEVLPVDDVGRFLQNKGVGRIVERRPRELHFKMPHITQFASPEFIDLPNWHMTSDMLATLMAFCHNQPLQTAPDFDRDEILMISVSINFDSPAPGFNSAEVEPVGDQDMVGNKSALESKWRAVMESPIRSKLLVVAPADAESFVQLKIDPGARVLPISNSRNALPSCLSLSSKLRTRDWRPVVGVLSYGGLFNFMRECGCITSLCEPVFERLDTNVVIKVDGTQHQHGGSSDSMRGSSSAEVPSFEDDEERLDSQLSRATVIEGPRVRRAILLPSSLEENKETTAVASYKRGVRGLSFDASLSPDAISLSELESAVSEPTHGEFSIAWARVFDASHSSLSGLVLREVRRAILPGEASLEDALTSELDHAVSASVGQRSPALGDARPSTAGVSTGQSHAVEQDGAPIEEPVGAGQNHVIDTSDLEMVRPVPWMLELRLRRIAYGALVTISVVLVLASMSDLRCGARAVNQLLPLVSIPTGLDSVREDSSIDSSASNHALADHPWSDGVQIASGHHYRIVEVPEGPIKGTCGRGNGLVIPGFRAGAKEFSRDDFRHCLKRGRCPQIELWQAENSSSAVPLTSVSHAEARQICASIGLRLPANAEWDRLVELGNADLCSSVLRGQGASASACSVANIISCPLEGEKSHPVSTASDWGNGHPLGIRHLFGNVSEWSAEGDVRGGNYEDHPQQARPGRLRNILEIAGPSGRSPRVGFRCVQ